MFLIFWDFLMIDQIFISPHMKRAWLVINMVYTSCLMSCLPTSENLRKLGNIRKISKLYGFISSCTYVSRFENFVSTSKNLLKNRNWFFIGVSYFTWKLQFVSNISRMNVSRNSFFLLTSPRPLQVWFVWQFS